MVTAILISNLIVFWEIKSTRQDWQHCCRCLNQFWNVKNNKQLARDVPVYYDYNLNYSILYLILGKDTIIKAV